MRYAMSLLGRETRGLQSCSVVGGVPLLEEWPLPFDAVATCPDIRGPVDDAATTGGVMIIPMAGLTGVESRGLGGVNHDVISSRSRE
jgi:hypothetical protein